MGLLSRSIVRSIAGLHARAGRRRRSPVGHPKVQRGVGSPRAPRLGPRCQLRRIRPTIAVGERAQEADVPGGKGRYLGANATKKKTVE